MIANLVVLGSGGLDRRSLFGIKGPILDGGFIGYLGHLPAQGIDLFHQLAFGHPAD